MIVAINMLIYQFSNLVLGFMVTACLTPRFKKLGRVACLMIFFALIAGPSSVKFFILTQENALVDFLYNMSIVIYLFYAFLLFNDAIWKKLTVVITTIAVITLGEELTLAIIDMSTEEFLNESLTATGLLIRTIDCGIILSLGIPLILIWRRFINQEMTYSFSILKTVCIPVACFFLTELTSKFYNEAGETISNQGAIVLAALYLIEMLYVLTMANNNERFRKKLELYELQKQIDNNKTVIEKMQENAEHQSVIRHDRKNILAALEHMVENGQYEEANKLKSDVLAKEGLTD